MHKIYIYIGYGPILLNLLAVQWMTTQSPSWCLGAVGFNVGVNVHQNFNITDGCYLTPFIYTAIADVALIIFTYISYKLARYYRFDDVEEDLDESMTYDEDHDHNPRAATINTRRTMGSRTTTSISTRGYTSSSNKTTRGVIIIINGIFSLIVYQSLLIYSKIVGAIPTNGNLNCF